MSAQPGERRGGDIVFAPRAAVCERRDDGALLLTSPLALGDYRKDLGSYLRQWARLVPERPFLCERRAEADAGWCCLSYGAALEQARSIAQWLIVHGFAAGTPVLILSPASLEHGLLMLGCLLAGVPFAPVSPALSQSGGEFRKLRAMADVLRPTLVFAQQEAGCAAALAALRADRQLMCVAVQPMTGGECIAFADLLSTAPTSAVEERTALIEGGTVVKYLFTSGSTGSPKAVPNTHRMLCANQKMMELVVHGDPDEPPVFLDWLPWSHTFGGNVTFYWILREGGTLHLDFGKPVTGLFDVTLRNLLDVSPTHYFNVPTGYAMLAAALEESGSLARAFFARLQFFFYGGASLPQLTWDRLQSLAVRYTGREVMFTTGCGSTETGPIGTFLHWPVQRAGVIGLPVPGVELKLVPAHGRLEMRIRGPNIFDHYLRQPQATAEAFDEEGYYRTGDAVRLVDPDDPAQGLVFDGRVTEDFKLATGTFVQVGNVRVSLLSAAPLVQDAVLAGPDRPWLGALVWLDRGACRALGAEPPHLGGALDPNIRSTLRRQLVSYNNSTSGSSQRVRRARVLLQPAVAEEGEITEKGYINQRAVLARRTADLEKLYRPGDCDGLVIDVPEDTSSLPAA